MKISKETLLEVLDHQTGWVESTFLADIFQVTSRTIRNYVTKINDDQEMLIDSCYKGYKINKAAFERLKQTQKKQLPVETPSERPNYIVRKLISSHNALNVFNLAEELFISDSTLESDLKRVRSLIKYFDLQIIRNRDQISIEGSERSKRKLINHLISIENHNNFMVFTNLSIISNDYQATELCRKIAKILGEHHLYINDYGLNNIILHLLVTIDRIKNNKNISETVSLERVNQTKDFSAAVEIKALTEAIYKIPISDAELYYLTLTISSNSNVLDYSFVTSDNIDDYIDKKYIRITRRAIRHLEETYYLEPFDDNFFVKLTIHIRNLFQRANNNIYVKNPLAAKIKTTYPLIYDMAVFIANEVKNKENLYVNEDEIAFIAFHIGSYLDNSQNSKNKVSCVFVYADYHDMHQSVLAQLKQTFENDLSIIKAVSAKDIGDAAIVSDIVISSVSVALATDAPVVEINLFPTEQDIENIRSKIGSVKIQKKNELMMTNIKRFLDRRIFKKEYYAKDELEMIERLADECHRLGLCDASFKDDVLERETLSSTSFSNLVAVPHSLKQNARQSFLSVVVNEKGMQWGSYSVNIIVLIGINKENRTAFREIFDDLIAILCEPTNVTQLLKCRDYDDFIQRLTQLMA